MLIKKGFLGILILYTVNISCANDWTRLLKDAVVNEGKLEFYGKVLDQDSRTVKGVAVLYETSSVGFPKPFYNKGRVKTDKKGLFMIKGGHVSTLVIEGIEMPGYELRNCPPSFDFRQDYRYRYKPDKDNPVVLRVRRKDYKGSYLFKRSVAIKLSMDNSTNHDGKSYGKDLAQEITYELAGGTRDEAGAFWDIEATGEADTEKGIWNVTLKTNGENSGIQRLDNLLYAAPADGYDKELKLTITFGKERFQHGDDERQHSIRNFYARLRDPGMYARLDVEKIMADKSQLLIYCHVLINPYGDKSFEELVSLAKKLSISEFNNANDKKKAMIYKSCSLFSEAEPAVQKAMREQRFAERPPFEEWIKEGLAFW